MSSDRSREDADTTAPRLAAAMESVRAVTDRAGPSSERARLGRLAGGRRVREDAAEPAVGDEPQQT